MIILKPKTKCIIATSVGVVIALLAVHVGASIKGLLWVMLCVLGGWSLFFPAAGLVSIIPMLYMIQPAPVTLGWEEIGFASILGVSSVSTVVQGRARIIQGLKKHSLPVGVVCVFLALNYMAAQWHEVPTSDWFRGIAPFLFILYFIPVLLVLRDDPSLGFVWRVAGMTTAGLFSWHVVFVFISEQLWQPSSYVNEAGRWLRVSQTQGEALGLELVWLKFRVTQLLSQSTDVLLPLGLVWGVLGALWSPRQAYRLLSLGLGILSTVSIVVTYTRSMLLVAGIVVACLLALALRRGQVGRGVFVGIAILGTLFGTIQLFGLHEVFLGRFASMGKQLSSSLSTLGDHGAAGENKVNNIVDANITSRLEEYSIAWDMFMKSPILGQGLGVRHAIRYETNPGETIEVFVGYVHNWVLYILMTTGILGLMGYTVLLFGPGVQEMKKYSREKAVLATVSVLALYSLFFVVFRLIPFNLVLGALWGMTLSHTPWKEEV